MQSLFFNLAPWLNGLQCRLVTPCGAGSNPVGAAILSLRLTAGHLILIQRKEVRILQGQLIGRVKRNWYRPGLENRYRETDV